MRELTEEEIECVTGGLSTEAGLGAELGMAGIALAVAFGPGALLALGAIGGIVALDLAISYYQR